VPVPGIRSQLTAWVTWFSSAACMPGTGWSSVRVVMVGAQSGTDSGYTSPIGASAGMVSSIRVVRVPGLSAGTSTASSIASPWRTWAGEVVTVTPAAFAAPGQPTAPASTAVSNAAAHRP